MSLGTLLHRPGRRSKSGGRWHRATGDGRDSEEGLVAELLTGVGYSVE